MLPDNNPWLSLACKVRCYWFPITSLWLLRSWIISGVSARWRPLLDTPGTTSPQLYWTFLKKHADGAKLICTASCCAQRSGDSDTSPSCTGEMSTCPGVTLTGEPASCVCVCVCVPPPRRAARLSPKMVSPVQGRSLCCVCSLLHAFKVGGPCSANVPWRADGGFTGGSSHVRALRQAIPAAWTRTWQLIPPPPRITTTERCEGGGWAYHHIGSRSWCCP